MKPTSANPSPAPDWSRAKRLLGELKVSTRRSVSAKVLLGKSLSTLKMKLGFIHGRNQWSAHNAHSTAERWDDWCKTELDGTHRATADRWIQCFTATKDRAKALRNEARREAGKGGEGNREKAAALPKWETACRLLEMPDDELDGSELEELAACVDGLVAYDTQAGLLEELGIVKGPGLRPGGPSNSHKDDGELDHEAISRFFIHGFSESTKALKVAGRFIDYCDFDAYLYQLPLAVPDEEPETGKKLVSLMDLKTALEDLRAKFKDTEERLQATVKRAESAIEAGMVPDTPKPRRGRPKAKGGSR